MLWFVISVGGAIGALARHLVNVWVQQRMPATGFPAGIFLINVTGCLAIGLVAGSIAAGRVELSEQAKAFLLVGVLGGFTTFSSFGLDTLVLVRAGQPGLAALNVIGQTTLGVLAVWAGFAAGAWRR
jgi:CrcB protein